MPTIASADFDFRKSVAYNPACQAQFLRLARRQLRLLAKVLDLATNQYDLRSNRAGITVSGEVTLHADHLYVQACQPATGCDTGILFRTCRGRKDYHGCPNNFASLDLLNRPADLARRIKETRRG